MRKLNEILDEEEIKFIQKFYPEAKGDKKFEDFDEWDEFLIEMDYKASSLIQGEIDGYEKFDDIVNKMSVYEF